MRSLSGSFKLIDELRLIAAFMVGLFDEQIYSLRMLSEDLVQLLGNEDLADLFFFLFELQFIIINLISEVADK